MSWDELKNQANRSGGLFVKLKDKDTVEGVFRGDPHCYYASFGDPKEYTDWAEGRSFKFRVPFLVKDDEGTWTAKIFSGGKKTSKALMDAIEEYGIDCVFKIKRSGSGKDDTHYSILFREKLPKKEIEKVNHVPLPALLRGTGRGLAQGEEPPPPTEEDRNLEYEKQEEAPF